MMCLTAVLTVMSSDGNRSGGAAYSFVLLLAAAARRRCGCEQKLMLIQNQKTTKPPVSGPARAYRAVMKPSSGSELAVPAAASSAHTALPLPAPPARGRVVRVSQASKADLTCDPKRSFED